MQFGAIFNKLQQIVRKAVYLALNHILCKHKLLNVQMSHYILKLLYFQSKQIPIFHSQSYSVIVIHLNIKVYL